MTISPVLFHLQQSQMTEEAQSNGDLQEALSSEPAELDQDFVCAMQQTNNVACLETQKKKKQMKENASSDL